MGHKKVYKSLLDGIYTECPSCNSEIRFINIAEPYGIEVNVESNGEVYIPGMYHLFDKCNNPLCRWSRVKVHE